MRWLCAIWLAGCALYPGKPGPGDDHCAVAFEQAPVEQLLDPSTLVCNNFGGGGLPCDPSCGPCPVAKEPVQAVPSWGFCSSQCTGLDEAMCATTPGCRIALDWNLYYTNQPSFIGCFATDMMMTETTDCAGLGAQDCSRSDRCTGLYGPGVDMGRTFEECIPVGQHAGSCTGTSTCTTIVSCPPDRKPGIENDCFTGSCIPNQFCPQI